LSYVPCLHVMKRNNERYSTPISILHKGGVKAKKKKRKDSISVPGWCRRELRPASGIEGDSDYFFT